MTGSIAAVKGMLGITVDNMALNQITARTEANRLPPTSQPMPSAMTTTNKAMKKTRVVQSTASIISSISGLIHTRSAVAPIRAITEGTKWKCSPVTNKTSMMLPTTPAFFRWSGWLITARSDSFSSKTGETTPEEPTWSSSR